MQVLSSLKPIIYMILVLGCMLGLISFKVLPRKLAMWAISPILFAVALSIFKGFFTDVVDWRLVLLVVGGTTLLILILGRLLLGRNISQGVASNFFYDVIKVFLFLPYYLIKLVICILFGKLR